MSLRDISSQHAEYPAWDDPRLQVRSESRWRARYRLLQSWYRENVIGAPPGQYRGHLRGNHLPQKWLCRDPHANFLTREVGRYVDHRVSEVQAEGGTLEETRLRSNLLSSMPLCFNIFGELRAHQDVVAPALSAAMHLDMSAIDVIKVEWAPPPADHLRDRTAFDAYIEYRTAADRRGFVGVETKYTENFSPEEYDRPVYRSLTASDGSGFKRGAADVLKGRATNQLWRNAMLAVSLKRAKKFDEAHVAVLACEQDRGVLSAVGRFREQLVDPESMLRALSYEHLLEELAKVEPLREWAGTFRRRYLDLEPISNSGVVS